MQHVLCHCPTHSGVEWFSCGWGVDYPIYTAFFNSASPWVYKFESSLSVWASLRRATVLVLLIARCHPECCLFQQCLLFCCFRNMCMLFRSLCIRTSHGSQPGPSDYPKWDPEPSVHTQQGGFESERWEDQAGQQFYVLAFQMGQVESYAFPQCPHETLSDRIILHLKFHVHLYGWAHSMV